MLTIGAPLKLNHIKVEFASRKISRTLRTKQAVTDNMQKITLLALAALCALTIVRAHGCGSANFKFGSFRNVFIINSMCSNPMSPALNAYCGRRGGMGGMPMIPGMPGMGGGRGGSMGKFLFK
jgi:uncharacterized membrane protein